MNRTTALLTLSALAHCDAGYSEPAVTSTVMPLLGAARVGSACSVPMAVPNDGLDDLRAIQDAINGQGCARLETGTYDIASNRTAGHRWDIISIGPGRSLTGSGPATRLVFTGDAGRSEWRGVGISGDDGLVADLTIDTSALVGTEEQTHAVHISGPAQHATVRGVWFYHPVRGEIGARLPGGDCVKIKSYEDTKNADGTVTKWSSSALIANNHFIQCDRSGIASIGGFYGLVISGNTFYQAGDQDVDVEAKARAFDLVISGNVFLLGDPAGGTFAVSLNAPRLDRFSFTGNVLNGRGVTLYSARAGTISGNSITSTRGLESTVKIIKSNDDIAITGNVIIRTPTADPSAVISISPHSTGMPGTVTLTGNILRNETPWGTVVQSAARRLSMVGNVLEWRPQAGAVPPKSSTLFVVHGITQRIDSVSLVGNTFVGPATSSVEIIGKDLGVAAVTLVGNTASVGFKCLNVATNPVGPFVSAANNWPASTSNSCLVTAGN